MEKKVCNICKIEKPITDFHKDNRNKLRGNSGYQSKCKMCFKKYANSHKKEKVEYDQLYRTINEKQISEYKKEYAIKNKDKIAKQQKIYSRKYRQTETGKMVTCMASAKARQLYPQKVKAINAVNNAIRNCKLLRQPCSVCGTNKNIHGHHPNYNKPLDIIWLCRTHHMGVHRIMKELKRS